MGAVLIWHLSDGLSYTWSFKWCRDKISETEMKLLKNIGLIEFAVFFLFNGQLLVFSPSYIALK